EVADARDVVVMRVRDRQHVEALAPVVAVEEGIVELLEEIYALAGAAVDVDQHVAVAGILISVASPCPTSTKVTSKSAILSLSRQPLRPPGQRYRLRDGADRLGGNGRTARASANARPRRHSRTR